MAIVIVTLGNQLFAQMTNFKSIEDSLPLKATVYVHEGDKKILELKTLNGEIDFS